jgi:FemAB-related protein (PEP-CTERM system-associated)
VNAPFAPRIAGAGEAIRPADLAQPDEAARIEGFVAELGGSVFHRPAWLEAIELGTGQRAYGLVAEKDGTLTGWLPLTDVRSPIFGRALVSSVFAVGGGVLTERVSTALSLADAAQALALELGCSSIELRGGPMPRGWDIRSDSHCGFEAPLAADDEAQLLAIPRKQRAEVRKGLEQDLTVHVGNSPEDRAAHFACYAESVRNLGTPVFPKSLFAAVLDTLDSDILTIRHLGHPVASVLSLFHGGAVLPFWGGGTQQARALRANDRMYYELMLHARRRGCASFDFGRSKSGSGAYHFKKNWGFEPQPLSYANWTAPGAQKRDADPNSAKHAARIALWKKLPLPIANRLGPLIARGLG